MSTYSFFPGKSYDSISDDFLAEKMQVQNHSIREFRIVLPMTVHQIGQLWSVAQSSKNETGGGEGVEVLVNQPFDTENFVPSPKLQANGQYYLTGQFTHKIYHLSEKAPSFVKLLMPRSAMKLHELSWNAYPYSRTILTNPDYMKEKFYVIIESFHASDRGEAYNILGLDEKDLGHRQIVIIDIANDKAHNGDYSAEWDPCLVGSVKANRPPLPNDKTGEWMQRVSPVMCCYKVVKVWFKWFGLQKRMENFILSQERRLFLTFHRQVVCWQDHYHHLTLDDIRRIEEEVSRELEKQRIEGPVRGIANLEDNV